MKNNLLKKGVATLFITLSLLSINSSAYAAATIRLRNEIEEKPASSFRTINGYYCIKQTRRSSYRKFTGYHNGYYYRLGRKINGVYYDKNKTMYLFKNGRLTSGTAKLSRKYGYAVVFGKNKSDIEYTNKIYFKSGKLIDTTLRKRMPNGKYVRVKYVKGKIREVHY